MPKHDSIAQVLVETGEISSDTYEEAVCEWKRSAKSPHEILYLKGQISMDELLQAVHLSLEQSIRSRYLSSQGSASKKPGETDGKTDLLEEIIGNS